MPDGSWLFVDPEDCDTELLALVSNLQQVWLVRDGWDVEVLPDQILIESWEWAHDQALGMDERQAGVALWLIGDGVEWEHAIGIARRLA